MQLLHVTTASGYEGIMSLLWSNSAHNNSFDNTHSSIIYLGIPPGLVTNVDVTVLNSTSIQVIWDPPIVGQRFTISSYAITRIGNPLDSTTNITIIAAQADLDAGYTEVLTELEEFNEYQIGITATNFYATGPVFTVSPSPRTNASVPGDSPTITSFLALNSTVLQLYWIPPTDTEQNGEISSYNITISGDPFSRSPNFITVPVSTPLIHPANASLTYDITDLQEFNSYTVSIAAVNSIGTGPFTDDVSNVTDSVAPAAAPNETTATSFDPTSLNITFLPPPGIDQNGPIRAYDVLYTGQNFQVSGLVTTISVTEIAPMPEIFQNTITLQDLNEFETYSLQLRAVNSEGDGPFSPTFEGITLEAVPNASPTITSFLVLNSTALELNWTPPTDTEQNGEITSYCITISGDPFGISPSSISVPVLPPLIYPATASQTYAITGLEEFANYTVSIAAVNSAGTGPFTDDVEEMTDPAAPIGAPLNVTIMFEMTTSFNLSWEPPSPIEQNGIIQNYTITITGTPFDPPLANLSVSTPSPPTHPATETISTNITGLEEYNNYTVTVTAVNEEGTGPVSAQISVMLLEAAPDLAPVFNEFSDVGPTNFTINWLPPLNTSQNGIITDYVIQIDGDIFPFTTVIPNISTDGAYPAVALESLNITGLEEYTLYTVRIAAMNSQGIGPFSMNSQLTSQSAPSASPTTLTVDRALPTSIDISFFQPAAIGQNGPILSYDVFYRGVTFDTEEKMENYPVLVPTDPAFVTSIAHATLTGLQEFNEYFIRVRAVNAEGVGPLNHPVDALTAISAPVAAPNETNATSLSSTSLDLTFLPPPGIDQNGPILAYDVFYTGVNFNTSQQVTRISVPEIDPMPEIFQNTITLEGLDEFETYQLQLSAVNSEGSGPLSPVFNGTTLQDVPSGFPQSLSLTVLSSREIQVDFYPPLPIDQNGLITNYTVEYTGVSIDRTTSSRVVNVTSTTYPAVAAESCIITDLEEFNQYIFTVFATTSVGNGPETGSETARTLSAAPDMAPTNIESDSVTATTFTITWKPPNGDAQNGEITAYILRVSGLYFPPPANETVITQNVTAVQYPAGEAVSRDFSNLEAANNYTISIEAVNTNGSGPAINISVYTNETAPDTAPSIVRIDQITATSFTVHWNPPSNITQNGVITSYLMNITGVTFNFTGPILTISTEWSLGQYPAFEEQMYEVTGLEEFNEYIVSIAAVNSVGQSPYSTEVSNSTLTAVPGSPILVGANVLNSTTIRVTWRPPPPIQQNGIILSYDVSFTAVGDVLPVDVRNVQYMETYPIPADTLYAEDFNGLEEGITYDINVTARTSAGPGSPSESVRRVMTTIVAPPDLPPFNVTETNITAVTSNSITVSLPNVSAVFLGGELIGFTFSIQGFLAVSALFPNMPTKRSVDYIFMTNVTTVLTGPGNQFMLSDLLPNFNYQIFVSANNVAGTSAAVELDSVPLGSELPSSVPININVVNVSSSTIFYTWDNNLTTINGYLLSYRLYYAEEGQDTILSVFPVSTLGPYTYALSGLKANTLYSFSLAVVNQIGAGPNSTLLVTNTYPTIPTSTVQPLPVTESPPTDTGGIIEIRVPTQTSFPTATIVVIYIISDKTNPPLFTTLSATAAYNYVTGGNTDFIIIQAALGSGYFDRDGSYFVFRIGDNTESSYGGNTYKNYPLGGGTSYELSYYILFLNEEGVITAEFSTIGTSASVVTAPNERFCVECVVLPVLIAIILILIIIILLIILVFYWYRKRRAVANTVRSRTSPKKEIKLEKVEKKDEDNIYSNVHAKTKEEAVEDSVV